MPGSCLISGSCLTTPAGLVAAATFDDDDGAFLFNKFWKKFFKFVLSVGCGGLFGILFGWSIILAGPLACDGEISSGFTDAELLLFSCS